MTRIKRGTIKKARHKKVLNATKGFRGTRGRLYRVSKEALMHAGQYAYSGRRLRRRDARADWIKSITAALTGSEVTYSVFVNRLKKSNVELDRKILADIATNDPAAFQKILEKVTN